VASHFAAEQAARRLEESRRFEELSRSLAFMAHDLRNLANELSLTLANARSHIQNPEFQKDLLLSMEESVAGMQRLLDNPFLLVFLGVTLPTVLYLIWGILEIAQIPLAPS